MNALHVVAPEQETMFNYLPYERGRGHIKYLTSTGEALVNGEVYEPQPGDIIKTTQFHEIPANDKDKSERVGKSVTFFAAPVPLAPPEIVEVIRRDAS